uniref:Uncharacterized protein n=1 Tax=Platysiphonia delicata TaxID=2006979 RepID=A0A1Z1M0C4_9FLOR|nr:hypothetical protein [Platysiphonia delicata]ARW59498.1 hypothetical protein [Platysiphonia delicata]
MFTFIAKIVPAIIKLLTNIIAYMPVRYYTKIIRN